jgi:hypothetical protein
MRCSAVRKQTAGYDGWGGGCERKGWRLFPKNWVLLCLLAVLSFGPCSNLASTCVVGEKPSAPLGRKLPGGERRPVCLARPLSRPERLFGRAVAAAAAIGGGQLW